MLTLSLLLNVLVLAPVCVGLISDAQWAREAYGDRTAARGILLSIYFSIGAISAVLLWTGDVRMIAALLIIQVIYKLTTPFTVGSVANPVVVSNLFIAAFHTVTLLLIWKRSDA
ncbi:MAG: hypothetical protein PSX80_05190 [bacterium]|nr:hypothetical protein [bacterium]